MTTINDYIKQKPKTDAKKRIENGIWVESEIEIENWKRI